MKNQRRMACAITATLLGLYSFAPNSARAQNTVSFSTSAPGQTKSIDEWGVEVVGPSSDDMRQSIAHMGAQNIDLIAVNFWLHEPLQANGQIGRTRWRKSMASWLSPAWPEIGASSSVPTWGIPAPQTRTAGNLPRLNG